MGKYLGPVPDTLELELFDKFREIERNFRESRWEPSELNGGKLCEVAYSILKGCVEGSYPSKPYKPANFLKACEDLEGAAVSFGRSVRLLIPRVLIVLYDIRNNRNVGHVGGDVDPNHMDAVCVLHMAKWVVAELVRVFHGVTLDEASRLVETLADRSLPLVWDIGAVQRVLDNNLSQLEKTLVLLYSANGALHESALLSSLEVSKASNYRRDVLRPAHAKRLIEYDESSKTISISPVGSRQVEADIFPNANF